MHGFNGYQVTRDNYDVTVMPVIVIDYADRKQTEAINVNGETVKVTDQLQRLWLHFKRFDKEYANNIVKNYKVFWQFIQFEMCRRKLGRHDVFANHSKLKITNSIESLIWHFEHDPIISMVSRQRLIDEQPGIGSVKIWNRQHSLRMGCTFDVGGRTVLSLRFNGPWHTFNGNVFAPAASENESHEDESFRSLLR